MINENDIDIAIKDPNIASITISGMLFSKFMDENNEALQDEYLDYLNDTKIVGEEATSYPQYCYKVFNNLAIETYLEDLKNGL